MLEVATTLKLDFPKNPELQQKHFLVTEPMLNLGAVLGKFLIAQKVLASEEILERLAFEVCEDAFNDGVRILELRYAPTFITDGHANLTFEKIHQAFLKGIARAKKQMPMAVGLICILQRILPLKKAASTPIFFDCCDSQRKSVLPRLAGPTPNTKPSFRKYGRPAV